MARTRLIARAPVRSIFGESVWNVRACETWGEAAQSFGQDRWPAYGRCATQSQGARENAGDARPVFRRHVRD